MNYILSTKTYNYNIVVYEHEASPDYKLFFKGESINSNSVGAFYFTLTKPEVIKKMKSLHWLSSTGPDLISDAFRKIIEGVAADDVEFFDAIIYNGSEIISGYSVINVKKKTNCINLEKSEYKLTNFDPANPSYKFYYMVADEDELNANIVRSREVSTTIVVSKEFKDACVKGKLRGLVFCDSIDITPQQRSVCIGWGL